MFLVVLYTSDPDGLHYNLPRDQWDREVLSEHDTKEEADIALQIAYDDENIGAATFADWGYSFVIEEEPDDTTVSQLQPSLSIIEPVEQKMQAPTVSN